MTFFAELKRRNVIRVGVAYAVIGWVLAQVAEFAFENFGAPDWVLKSFVVVILLGLPVALFLAWAFELTPDGVKREKEVDRTQSITHTTGRKLDFIIIGALSVALAYFIWERQTAVEPVEADRQAIVNETVVDEPETGPVQRSIAVLPFVNMSSDKENEYFADGLSEELLNQLAQISDLQVASRTSSFSFKGTNQDLRAIGATLGVANVLEGSVRRQGNTVRVTAQLIRADDGFHLWSNTYDRTMEDVFVIQDDISSNVAEAMKIILDEPSRLRMQEAGVRNVEAFVEYQKGNEFFRIAHGSTAGMMDILEDGLIHFDRAIELVPDFAAAEWGRYDYFAHAIMEPKTTAEQRKSALVEIRRILDKAYRLSAGLPRQPMIDFDRVLFSDDWTSLQDRAEKAYATSTCPEPTWIEVVDLGFGFEAAARGMWRQLVICDPMSHSGVRKLSVAEAALGDYDAAYSVLDEGDQRLGASTMLTATRQWLLMAEGRLDEALLLGADLRNASIYFGTGADALPLALSGDTEAAKAAMEEWIALYGRNIRVEIEIYAAIGDREQANRLAAELDARPAGPMMLLLISGTSGSGAMFDLEATPYFRKRIEEAGLNWPPKKYIDYPAKDW